MAGCAYDPAKLEIQIHSRGPNSWEWTVAEKGKAAIRSGVHEGARSGAVHEANDALMELVDAAEDYGDEQA